MPADRRTQVQRQPGTAIGAIAEFVEGRGLETTSARQVQAPVGAGIEHHARDRRGLGIAHATAVIGVGGGDVMIARGEPHRAVARAGEQRPAIGEAPPRLRILVHVLHPVAFVATRPAPHAPLRIDEILVTAPVLALAVRIHAHGGLKRPRGQFALPRPARVDAGLVIAQIDDAAAVERIALRTDGKRQELFDIAAAGIGRRAQAMTGGQRLIQHQPELILAHRLAGVELVRGGDRLRRVRAPLRPGQAERILRARRIEMVEHQIQRALARQIETQLAVERLAPRRAVVPVAVGVENAGREVVVHPALRT